MSKDSVNVRDSPSQPPKNRKAHKGVAMEGPIATWYAKTQRKSLDQYKSWANIAINHIPNGGSVLEIAPGPGYLSIELAKLLDPRQIIGLDLSKTFVKIAEDNARAANLEIQYRQGDAAYMPFQDNSFDFAICTSAFKNFPEPVRVLDEIYRVLKEGREAVIIDLRKDAPRAKVNEFVERMKLGAVNSLMTKMTFKSLLKSAYLKNQVLDFARESRFGKCEIVDEEIGFEMWLKKQSS
jgi:ubiquinone/menaquinone biosynthesis C-methylase UbiE